MNPACANRRACPFRSVRTPRPGGSARPPGPAHPSRPARSARPSAPLPDLRSCGRRATASALLPTLGALVLLCAAAVAAADPGPFDEVLAKAGLTEETARFDLADMDLFGGGPHRTPTWRLFVDRPFKIPGYTDRFRESLQNPAPGLYTPLLFGFLRLGHGVRRNLLGDPNAPHAEAATRPDALAAALAEVLRAGGEAAPPPDLVERCQAVPPELARPVAFLLRAIAAAAVWRDSALRDFSAADRERLFEVAPRLLSLLRQANQEEARFVEEAMARVDLDHLAAGAGDLTLALAAALEELRKYSGPRGVAFSAATPWGDVVVNGEGVDSVAAGRRILLLVDLGGNDAYAAGGGNADFRQPASVLIDLGGDDAYTADAKTPAAFGSGLLGYGFLVDAAGNDRYDAAEFAQGAALFGAGGLWDLAGDDRYRLEALGQGAACVGAAALLDVAGTDRYECTSYAQGYGYVLGAGVLVDHAGNDEYLAQDVEIRHPSAQSKEHNVSMAQGCGFGKRADFVDGHSLAGGVGVLVDHAGDDRYRCGVFGQGCGYWYGAGMLLDGGGNDTYDGVWYVQGAPAHFALGILNDRAGNDRYTATMNMAQGAGHDFSLGFLVDREGNDLHQAPNLSLGAGNDNGMGVLWDAAGDDTYESKGITLGASAISGKGTLREDLRCIGLFLDGGGKDMYLLPHAKDGATWGMAEAGRASATGERGAGQDRP